MSDTQKHTPGPWFWQADGSLKNPTNQHIILNAGAFPKLPGKENGSKEDHANAALISAAPETAADRDRWKELAEARGKVAEEFEKRGNEVCGDLTRERDRLRKDFKRLVQLLKVLRQGTPEERVAILDEADAAIARAEGRA